jgi:enamine deaminase RidA (YjgF/YER057c/UK114 family)
MSERLRVSSGSPYEEAFGFCRAIRVGNTIHVAGTAPIGADGRTVGVGDPAAQVRRCFDIIKHALEELGGGLDDVVMTRMYLTRIADQEIVGRIHGEYLGDARPVATMVQVRALCDPEWLVEIEAEAIL